MAAVGTTQTKARMCVFSLDSAYQKIFSFNALKTGLNKTRDHFLAYLKLLIWGKRTSYLPVPKVTIEQD